ncbi:MAG: aldehyde dehydrogenase family protein [Chloroflexi bacterium]|nr:aldehyde dehydrogenase family protein [Chloroflexota bacterium]
MSSLAADRPSSESTTAKSHPSAIDPGQLARLVRTVAPRAQMTVTSPLDGQLVGSVPMCVAEDVAHAVEVARTAQRAWAALPVRERVKPFRRFNNVLLDRRFDIADLIQLENGKVRANALEDVFDACINTRFYSYHGPSLLRPQRQAGAVPLLTASTVIPRPFGVVGLIEAWNYPFNLPMQDAVAALIAGNAVVMKVSELTPFSALFGLQLLRACGLPDDVFQIVTGDGKVAGAALIDYVDTVMFTGSTATGRKIAAHCAERLIPCSLELGGKNPVIVLEDADLDTTLDVLVDSTLASAGQMCVSFERVFIHESRYDAVRDGLAKRYEALPMGVRRGAWDDELSVLTSANQLSHVQRHIEDAVAKGARVVTGGKARPDVAPYAFEPTLLENVTPDMAVFDEETFGPVVSLYRFSDVDDAVRRANASQYGLNAAVFGRDVRRARDVAHQIQCGTVTVNEGHKAAWASVRAPQGGWKQSGYGRRHGAEGILKFTQSQSISVQRFMVYARGERMSVRMFDRIYATLMRVLPWLPGLR